MVIELRVVQFWSEIILVTSNRTRAARSSDSEITRMISEQIALHSVQLPLYTKDNPTGFPDTYPLDSDLCDRQRYSTFKQPGPELKQQTQNS